MLPNETVVGVIVIFAKKPHEAVPLTCFLEFATFVIETPDGAITVYSTSHFSPLLKVAVTLLVVGESPAVNTVEVPEVEDKVPPPVKDQVTLVARFIVMDTSSHTPIVVLVLSAGIVATVSCSTFITKILIYRTEVSHVAEIVNSPAASMGNSMLATPDSPVLQIG